MAFSSEEIVAEFNQETNLYRRIGSAHPQEELAYGCHEG
jgi:hypothetical protein